MRDKNLAKAIEILGGNAAVARLFQISREAVRQWYKCPAERVLTICDATRDKVKPHELRPDIYRAPKRRAA